MKILNIFGTRPEAIKMAPVVKLLACNPFFESRVCVTGQHREMLDQVLSMFDIQPDIDLALMTTNQSISELTQRILQRLEGVFKNWTPNLVLVHGDTTTSMAASLSAYYARIAIGHVEAGLRTGNKYAPWPEEKNRHITDVLADLHFAPTTAARDNLLKENIPPNNIYVTGNTVIDALLAIKNKLDCDPLLRLKHEAMCPPFQPHKKLILVTGHRRENFGAGFEHICKALSILAKREDVQLVYPVHLNPHVYEPVCRHLKGLKNITLIQPLDYPTFVYLMTRSSLILTDSGGIQEEAPALGKPVLVMRESTERPEALHAGITRLIGTDPERIVYEVSKLLDNEKEYNLMAHADNPYGDGTAAHKIVKILQNYQNNRNEN